MMSQAWRTMAALAASALLALASPAAAETFPTRPIKLIVPWPTGGATDQVARILADAMRKDLGQSVVVDNKPGATGRIGVDAARAAVADGYTLVMAISSTHGIAAALNPKLPYDPVKDFTPIGLAAVGPLAVTVHPSVPVTSLSELVEYAKRNPGKLNFASAGAGSGAHLMGEMLQKLAGLQMVHVPYKGTGQAVQDVVAGHAQLLIDGAAVKNYIADGRLRVLATTGSKRWSALPQVPTTAEAGMPQLQTAGWFGLMGPKGVPPAVVARLNQSLASALQSPDVQQALKNQGFDLPSDTGSAQMANFIASEVERWRSNLRLINYTPTE